MKLQLIAVGEMREAPLRELITRYASRIPHYMPFELVTVPDIRTRGLSEEAQKAREGAAILSRITPGDCVVLLDERGRQLTSRELAAYIDRKASTVARNLCFVIGGPYGFSPDVYARADMQLGLSRLTFTHEMARVLTAEQLYRAMTILRGEPYHHD